MFYHFCFFKIFQSFSPNILAARDLYPAIAFESSGSQVRLLDRKAWRYEDASVMDKVTVSRRAALVCSYIRSYIVCSYVRLIASAGVLWKF